MELAELSKKSDAELVVDCLLAIENGNCTSCAVCPIFRSMSKGKEAENEIVDMDRTIAEHRFGVGADDVDLMSLKLKKIVLSGKILDTKKLFVNDDFEC